MSENGLHLESTESVDQNILDHKRTWLRRYMGTYYILDNVEKMYKKVYKRAFDSAVYSTVFFILPISRILFLVGPPSKFFPLECLCFFSISLFTGRNAYNKYELSTDLSNTSKDLNWDLQKSKSLLFKILENKSNIDEKDSRIIDPNDTHYIPNFLLSSKIYTECIPLEFDWLATRVDIEILQDFFRIRRNIRLTKYPEGILH